MKYRKSFVTNSSSSSFVCDICGNVESGYDASPSDVGMVQCKNDHIFCEHHAKVDQTITKEDIVKELESELKNYRRCQQERPEIKYYQEYIDQYEKDLVALNTLDGEELEDIIIDLTEALELDYNIPVSKCPICNFNLLVNSDVIRYIYKVYDINEEDIRNNIKSTFTSYEEFIAFIRGKE